MDDGNRQFLAPLADRMRPRSLDELVGQDHLLGDSKPLTQLVNQGALQSLVFWGPPGTGKTTLARLLANAQDAEFVTLSAVTSGVKDIRASVDVAKQCSANGRATLLFVDEVHRFNKSQQDAFLPFIEDGTIYFVGATTENPSFELNNALLSRLRVHVLKPIDADDLQQLMKRAVTDKQNGLGDRGLRISQTALETMALAADGDARRALNFLEAAADFAGEDGIDESVVEQVIGARLSRFDKGGDAFYDQISALHKSIRGSDPDAALYWLARMLSGGCDPHYVLRRLIRIASEDIGNADPRALPLVIAAWNAFDRLGTPEGELAIAHAASYLACAPKSNSVYKAFIKANEDAARFAASGVPIHLKNAPTGLMKNLGHGADYRYDPDQPNGFSKGQTYFPDEMGKRIYYKPGNQGLEQRISEKLRSWRETSV